MVNDEPGRSSMKILFTGSSGPNVAATVAAQLAVENDVYGIDLVASPTTRSVADITKITDWRPYLDGVDAVVHFAALHAPHRATHSREAFFELNVATTQRLVDSAKAAGVRRFLLASTTSVYGRAMRPIGKAVWVTEALSPVAEDIYDQTKLAAEQICRDAFSPSFVTTALRFSRSFAEPLREMAVYRLYRGVDARDVAQAFGRALVCPLAGFEAFNISGSTPFLESQCLQLLQNAGDVIRQVEPELAATFDKNAWALPKAIDRVYVIDKAKRILGYQPRFGWRSILRREAES